MPKSQKGKNGRKVSRADKGKKLSKSPAAVLQRREGELILSDFAREAIERYLGGPERVLALARDQIAKDEEVLEPEPQILLSTVRLVLDQTKSGKIIVVKREDSLDSLFAEALPKVRIKKANVVYVVDASSKFAHGGSKHRLKDTLTVADGSRVSFAFNNEADSPPPVVEDASTTEINKEQGEESGTETDSHQYDDSEDSADEDQDDDDDPTTSSEADEQEETCEPNTEEDTVPVGMSERGRDALLGHSSPSPSFQVGTTLKSDPIKLDFERINSLRSSLPIDSKKAQIISLISSNSVSIIRAPTGSGKSTRLVQFILESDPSARIVVSEPRRIAAVSLAERVSEELQFGILATPSSVESPSNVSPAPSSVIPDVKPTDSNSASPKRRDRPVGSDVVAYSIRTESNQTRNTQILFCTVGVLLRRLSYDPVLGPVTHVIVDEAHERDVLTDTLLILLRRLLLSGSRPDLKLVVLSATLDSSKFSEYFATKGLSAGELEVEGRTFPVDAVFLEELEQIAGKRCLHSPQQVVTGTFAATTAKGKPMSPTSPEGHRKDKKPQDLIPVDVEFISALVQRHLSMHRPKQGSSFSAGQMSVTSNLSPNTKPSLRGKASRGRQSSSSGSQQRGGKTPLKNPELSRSGTKRNPKGSPLVATSHEREDSLGYDNDGEVGEPLSASPETLNQSPCNISGDGVPTSPFKETVRYPGEILEKNSIKEKEQNTSVLIFVSGQREITRIASRLDQDMPMGLDILPLHSTLSTEDQKRVFRPARPGRIKVVVATNIAETSITIDDCALVIDTCRVKESRYDADSRVWHLEETLISKSALMQRRGRAGRTAPGKCFHLVPEALDMPDHPVPGMRKDSLEDAVLALKAAHRGQDAYKFFGDAIDPPLPGNIDRMLEDLSDLGVLRGRFDLATQEDETELTPLGFALTRLGTDCRKGKLLLLGLMLDCLDPVLTIAAGLDGKSPFFFHGDRARQGMDKIRRRFGENDFMALVRVRDSFVRGKLDDGDNVSDWVSLTALRLNEKLRDELVNDLINAGFLASRDEIFGRSGRASDWRVVRICLAGGLFPHIGRLDFDETNVRPITGPHQLEASRFDFATLYRPCKEDFGKFFVFHERARVGGTSSLMNIRKAIVVPAMALALLGGGFARLRPREASRKGSRFVTVRLGKCWLLRARPKDAMLVQQLRNRLDEALLRVFETKDIDAEVKEMLELLRVVASSV